ncbi:MAG: FG-GAP-like repeat-containing protein, partial [candidate division KSB1 bacterium]|nr:FG-GAP-like repeat-containing protein [candidate division KSB1 bacterium]
TMNDTVNHADARLLGQQAYDAAGYSVACNGDLNGDGLDDMIIGAPAGNDKVPYMPGRVYILFGRKKANWGYYFRLYDNCDAIYEGEGNQDLAGLSVAYIGDLNGDGYDDFLVGAPFRNGKYVDQGQVYLILGRATPWLKTDYLAYADATFIYEVSSAKTGYAVAGIGDVNVDGIPDFAIGAYGASHVFVLYGRPKVNWGKNFDLENADVIIYGENRWSKEGVGWRVAGGSDVNGDGISDLLISATQNSDHGTRSGMVYVLFGKRGGWGVSEISLNNADASYYGEQPGEQAGWGLAMAGDVNGDGFGDILVGTYKDENGPVNGKAYLIKGKASGWQRDVSLTTVPDFCERSPEGIGYAVASAGDFDADGLADYVISAPFNSDIQKWNGKVYLFTSQEVPYEISGQVTYHRTGQPIPQVMVKLDTLAVAADTTDGLGRYQILVRGKHDHTVAMEKLIRSDLGSAVSAYDAALIAQMAVKLSVPDTIHREAGDVNNDGKVSMYDAANTLRCAVQLPALPNTYAGQWVFTPSSMTYDSVTHHYSNQNYVGFVRGDVDGNWRAPGSGLAKSEDGSTGLQFQAVVNGDELRLPIELNFDFSMISFDLHISYPQAFLKLKAVEPSTKIANFQLAVNSELSGQVKAAGFGLQSIVAHGPILVFVFETIKPIDNACQLQIDHFAVNQQCFAARVKLAGAEPLSNLPQRFELLQNYPNPFNGTTLIRFAVPHTGKIRLTIYNLLGEEVNTLIDETVAPGKYHVNWDGKNRNGAAVASGIYIARMDHPSGSEQIKLIYMQ